MTRKDQLAEASAILRSCIKPENLIRPKEFYREMSRKSAAMRRARSPYSSAVVLYRGLKGRLSVVEFCANQNPPLNVYGLYRWLKKGESSP